MTIQEMIEEMIKNLSKVLSDAGKFDNGNKTAGTRVRVDMQDIKVQADVVRERIILIKNAE